MSLIFATASAQWAAMRAAYQDVLEAQYEAAEEATNGYMVNARGQAKGWTGMAVFTGPPTVVQAYASDELKEHLAAHPRTSTRAFEAQWFEVPDDGEGVGE